MSKNFISLYFTCTDKYSDIFVKGFFFSSFFSALWYMFVLSKGKTLPNKKVSAKHWDRRTCKLPQLETYIHNGGDTLRRPVYWTLLGRS